MMTKCRHGYFLKPFLSLFIFFTIFLTASSFKKTYRNIPDVTPNMLNADYWLSKTDKPDEVILTDAQKRWFNRHVYNLGYLVHPLYEHKKKQGRFIRRYLSNDIAWISRYYKYTTNNERINGTALNKDFKKIINYNQIPEIITNKFCLITKPSYIRAFPTNIMILKKTNDYPFDILQKGSLDTGKEVTLFHISEDGLWGYVQTPFTTGWVLLNNIAAASKKTVQKYINPRRFVMALKPKVTIYDSPEGKKQLSFIRLGSKLPLKKLTGSYAKVSMPQRNSQGSLILQNGYITNLNAVSSNYRKMTPRFIAESAFSMIGEPYSWGGFDFHSDCSSYIRRVFMTVGIEFPRSSNLQVAFLKEIFNKENGSNQFPDQMKPFRTLLYHRGPGHIMLYTGKVNGNHYVIHNKWSFQKPVLNQKGNHGGKIAEKTVYIKKVVVTPLSLGKGSWHGSIRQKISKIGEF